MLDRFRPLTALAVLIAACAMSTQTANAQFALSKGDRVSIIGNTLADRMQHDGWLETLIQSRFPDKELVFRNLGFTADELNKRPRTEGFGSPDEWLTKTQADVVFAFFGYNESFAGEGGLPGFRKELASFIDHTLSQKYNGKGAPRLVLFSPIAHENLHNPNLPDGSENNARLALYTKAMAEVAKEKGVTFVDLFGPTQATYASVKQPLTINGIHLTTEGNRHVAHMIDAALFGSSDATKDASLERLRQSVTDKNLYWFSRYRVIDEYNVFGGRSRLSWHGQSNADVMMREMEVFDVMTANRDRRVWAVARGSDLKVDDSNTPPLLDVKTNKPGPLDGGAYAFLGGEEAISKMQIAQGMKVNLFASEEQFPELINPVQMAVDPNGRVWVATWPSYPHWNPKEPRRDKLVILPDDDGDGKADRAVVFADNLNSVTGFEFWGGGVLVAMAPEIWFMKDTDGDDKADVRIRVMHGVSSGDSHHTANSLVIGPDGGLYYSHGIFHVDNTETPTRTFRHQSTGVYRFDPRTFEVDFHFPIGPNPHGDAIDQWGFHFASDGTSGTGGYIAIGKGVGAPHQWYQKRVRPVPATGFLSSSHFPERNQGNFLICNAIGFLGVLQYEVKYNGADITAEEIEPILVSSDPNFRPTDIEVAGDGALYVSDWQNPLIGHMQHNIRDPNRDHLHGRVYRVTAEGRPLLKPMKLMGAPIEKVLEAFHAKESGTRYRARLELSGRDTKDVTAAVTKWAASIEPDTPANEQALLEGLWTFEEHRVPNEELLRKVLRAKEPRVRAAAIRTLGHWGEKIKGWPELLAAGARDFEGIVRGEAVTAAPSFSGLAAAEAIFEAAVRPTDPQLDFNLNYARGRMNVDQIVQEALKNGAPMSRAAQTYALRNASVATLLSMQRTDAVNEALLARGGVPKQDRLDALAALGKTKKTSSVIELLAAIDREEANPQGALGDLLDILTTTDAAQLKPVTEQLAALAGKTASPGTRKAAYVAWLEADGDGDHVWAHAVKSAESLRDLLTAFNATTNTEVRASLYPKVRALMFELPAHLKDESTASVAFGAMRVAYHEPARQSADLNTYAALKPQAEGNAQQFKIDDAPLKRRDDFALVFTGAINIPKTGKYTFFTASDDGSRLYIDGDLVVNNDGLHGMAEKGGDVTLSAGPHEIVVTYFDNGGGDGLQVSWQGPGVAKQEIPAAVLSGGPGGGGLSDLAIAAVARMKGHEQERIGDFIKLITSDKHVASALQALATLPQEEVSKQLQGKADAVAAALVAQADKATPVERETSAYSNVLTLGESLIASASNKGDLRRKLAALRASIPIKADAKVMALGREVYRRDSHCGTCHQLNGQGLPNLYPPLDGSTWATGSEERLIRTALHGMYGTIKVKGQTFASPPLPPMTGFHAILNDEELAAVLTYVRNSWSNRAKPIEAKDVAAVRAKLKDRSEFWHAAELVKLFPLEEDSNVAVLDAPASDGGWVPTFVKAWTISDFEKELAPGASLGKRSFQQGELAFTRLGCVQCHKMRGKGGLAGPELTEVLKKWKGNRRDLLTQILEPSKVVEEKYRAYVVETADGLQLFGFVTERTKDSVTIDINPQNPSPQKFAAKDVVAITASPNSVMPQGLINLLERDFVLDLLAYLESGGDEKSAVFQP